MFEIKDSCCTICDQKKTCHICGTQTLFACADCRIDLEATVWVCGKAPCRDAHEEKCGSHIALQHKTFREDVTKELDQIGDKLKQSEQANMALAAQVHAMRGELNAHRDRWTHCAECNLILDSPASHHEQVVAAMRKVIEKVEAWKYRATNGGPVRAEQEAANELIESLAALKAIE